MYGLPDDFNGSFFVGCILENVLFSMNTVALGFDNEVSISIWSSFEHRTALAQEAVQIQRVPVTTCSDIVQLLGRSVEAVSAERDGTLTLHFGGGHVFRCFDDASGYECYNIGHGTEETIV